VSPIGRDPVGDLLLRMLGKDGVSSPAGASRARR
jgi:hypothetical protein